MSHPEPQHLDGIHDILTNGDARDTRNGRVVSKAGMSMRWPLADATLPLLTSKRVFWKGVKEELLWLISGNTYEPDLAARGGSRYGAPTRRATF